MKIYKYNFYSLITKITLNLENTEMQKEKYVFSTPIEQSRNICSFILQIFIKLLILSKTIPRALYELCHLIFIVILETRFCYCSQSAKVMQLFMQLLRDEIRV